jgi:hypothetical protein
MKRKLTMIPALFILAAAALLMLTLPRLLHVNAIANAIDGVVVEPMDTLPVQLTPVPVSDEERTEAAILWLNRADESSEFARRREDVSPGPEELSQEQAWKRLREQWEALAPWGLTLPAGEDASLYFRMVHGVTQDYQGYYVLTAGKGADAVACTVCASTGALLECVWTTPPFPMPALAKAFAKLWKIDSGTVLKHINLSSIDWEYCVYGNGGSHYIYIVSSATKSGCTVSLKPGTGERT